MLDGSITPFKVRSSIKIASLKSKFEPWQPMKGRALLHHDVRLDDRATLSSIPGIKNGTILRVDQHVSQAKKRSKGTKSVMSGPASLGMDEDVMKSIETSGDDEETYSEDERRISGNKRKRPSRTSSAAREDIIDDDDALVSLQRREFVSGESRGDPLNTTHANVTPLVLRTVKKERIGNTSSEQTIAPEAPNPLHPLHSLPNVFPLPLQDNPPRNTTIGAYFRNNTAPVSTHPHSMDLEDPPFLAGIKAAAAAETERLPLRPEIRPEDDVPPPRCDACGRACGCEAGSSTTSIQVVPAAVESVQGGEAAFPNSDGSGYRVANGTLGSQRAESSWTGM